MKNITVIIFITFIIVILTPAAYAATLSLSPSTGTFNKSCSFNLDVVVDSGGTETDGTDAILAYDSSRFTAQKITNGTIYPDFPGNNISESSGKITISGLASVATPFSGKGTLATINFSVKENASTGTTQVKFDFDPNDKAKTTDSNVVQRGTVVDVLNSVADGNYTVGTGACGATVSPKPQGAPVVSTPSASPKTLDQVVDKDGKSTGTTELTFTLAIFGSILTVLGILGLALL